MNWNRIVRFFRTRRVKKGLVVYRPCMCCIHPQAKVEIKGRLDFNCQWDDDRIRRNKKVGSLFMDQDAFLKADAFVVYSGCSISIEKGALLSLGSGYMNYDCVISCFSSITIGNDVAISERVVLRDSDNHSISYDDGRKTNVESEPIVIEDHVWIGMNATVLKGVTIGEGSVVAAGSLVNKDVPSHCMVAGVPAKVIRTNITWS